MKATGYFKVRFIATCKVIIIFLYFIDRGNEATGLTILLVNVLSLAFHSDTHLNRGSAQSFLSPSALAVYTSYQNDLIVIEYGK